MRATEFKEPHKTSRCPPEPRVSQVGHSLSLWVSNAPSRTHTGEYRFVSASSARPEVLGPLYDPATLGAQAGPTRAVRHSPGGRTGSRPPLAPGDRKQPTSARKRSRVSYLVGSRPALGRVREILLLSKWSWTAKAGSTAVPGVRDPHSKQPGWRALEQKHRLRRTAAPSPSWPGPAPAWRAACHAPTGPAPDLPCSKPRPKEAMISSLVPPHQRCASLPVGGRGVLA